jgi:hypothetical protein
VHYAYRFVLQVQVNVSPSREERAVTHAFTRKLGACAVATAVAVTMSATGFAAEPPVPAPSSSRLLASARKQVQQIVKTTAPAAARSAQEGTSGYDSPGSFLTSKRGIAVLALAAAGIGYVWYSAYNDRIHSQARERLDN